MFRIELFYGTKDKYMFNKKNVEYTWYWKQNEVCKNYMVWQNDS